MYEKRSMYLTRYLYQGPAQPLSTIITIDKITTAINSTLVSTFTFLSSNPTWNIKHKCQAHALHYLLISSVYSIPFGILYKYGSMMRAMWSFMDLRKQYWPRLHLGQYGWQRSIKPILPNNIRQYLLYYIKCLWFKHIGLWIHILLDSP